MKNTAENNPYYASLFTFCNFIYAYSFIIIHLCSQKLELIQQQRCKLEIKRVIFLFAKISIFTFFSLALQKKD